MVNSTRLASANIRIDKKDTAVEHLLTKLQTKLIFFYSCSEDLSNERNLEDIGLKKKILELSLLRYNFKIHMAKVCSKEKNQAGEP